MHWIFAHLIGDYLFQTDWMANNKKKNTWACIIHVIIYMIPFLFCQLTPLQLTLIAIQHFLQDRTNFIKWFMKIKGSRKFSEPPFAPWSIYLTDNILHILWILFVTNIF